MRPILAGTSISRRSVWLTPLFRKPLLPIASGGPPSTLPTRQHRTPPSKLVRRQPGEGLWDPAAGMTHHQLLTVVYTQMPSEWHQRRKHIPTRSTGVIQPRPLARVWSLHIAQSHECYWNDNNGFILSAWIIFGAFHARDSTKYVVSLNFWRTRPSILKKFCHLGILPTNLRGWKILTASPGAK